MSLQKNRSAIATKAAIAAIYSVVFLSQGLAASITISDPSFESPALSAAFEFITGTGWTATGGAPVIDLPLSNQFNSIPDGNQVAILDDFNGTGTLSQTLTATLAANTTYTLTFFVGNDKLLPFTGYAAALTANGATLASDSNVVAPTSGNFVEDTITFNSGASPAQLGQALGITFSDVNANAVAFDMVQLDASPTAGGGSTPEPGTWILLAAGLTILVLAKRRPAMARNVQAMIV